MCVGVISRDSCRQAFRGGITATQIIRFLQMHVLTSSNVTAHLPPTITDQIRLWEQERDRSVVLLYDMHYLLLYALSTLICITCSFYFDYHLLYMCVPPVTSTIDIFLISGSHFLMECCTISFYLKLIMKQSRTMQMAWVVLSGTMTPRELWWLPRMVMTMSRDTGGNTPGDSNQPQSHLLWWFWTNKIMTILMKFIMTVILTMTLIIINWP